MAVAALALSFAAHDQLGSQVLDRLESLVSGRSLSAEGSAAGAAARLASTAPLRADAYYLAARISERKGDIEHAEQLMNRAVRLNPRMSSARSWRVRRWLAAGRTAEAIGEIAVLYRLDRNPSPVLSGVLAEAARHPRARPLIARGLANNSQLLEVVRLAVGNGLEPKAGLELLGRTNLARFPSGVQTMQSALAEGLLKRSAYLEAYDVWAALLGTSRPRGPVFDPNFTLPDAAPPFSWAILTSAAVEAASVPSGLPVPKTALHVRVYSDLPQRIARQQLVLHPGKYELRYMAEVAGEPERAEFYWRITCTSGSFLVELPIAFTHRWTQRSGRLTVSPGCPSQLLELKSAGNPTGRVPELKISAVDISRA